MTADGRRVAGPCVYGDGWADPAVVVDEIERATVSAAVLYAHARCAELHGREPLSLSPSLPDASSLNVEQIRGHACARCGARLYASTYIGTVSDSVGPIRLWACRPHCPGERAG